MLMSFQTISSIHYGTILDGSSEYLNILSLPEILTTKRDTRVDYHQFCNSIQ